MALDKETILAKAIQAMIGFFSKSDEFKVQASVEIPLAPPKAATEPPKSTPEMLDWSNPESHITPRFKVKEALMLHSWGVMHAPSEEEKAAIVSIAIQVGDAMDYLETLLGIKCTVNVHAWIRPGKANCPGTKWDGMDYNRYIYETQVWKDLTDAEKAAKHVPESPHKTGHAIDFHITHYEGVENCLKIRQALFSQLERLNLRMEDLNGTWVHLDNLPVVHMRFFKP